MIAEVVDEGKSEGDVKVVCDRLYSDRRLSVYEIFKTVNMSKSTVNCIYTAAFKRLKKDHLRPKRNQRLVKAPS